jgi:anthranilate phosphoribosyltransferase
MNAAAELTGEVIGRIQAGEVVAREEISAAFLAVLERRFPGADLAWGALFGALHTRGPTREEVMGLVDSIMRFDPGLQRQLEQKVSVEPGLCVTAIAGSGKESFKTFNVSTAAAFVAACHPYLCVVKPAGSATSATTGASDVLKELGIRLPSSIAQAAELARRTGVGVFDYHLVARRYGARYEGLFHHPHPLSHITPWLFIPFQVDSVVFGVADPRVELAAALMSAAGTRHFAVVTTSLGQRGRIDELAPFGLATMVVATQDQPRQSTCSRPVPDDLDAIAQRDSHEANASALLQVLAGQAPALAHDIVCANAALLLRVAGLAGDEESGYSMADEFIRSGDAMRRLELCRRESRLIAV